MKIKQYILGLLFTFTCLFSPKLQAGSELLKWVQRKNLCEAVLASDEEDGSWSIQYQLKMLIMFLDAGFFCDQRVFFDTFRRKLGFFYNTVWEMSKTVQRGSFRDRYSKDKVESLRGRVLLEKHMLSVYSEQRNFEGLMIIYSDLLKLYSELKDVLS